MEFPLRKEYAQYVTWAAGHFERLVDYGVHVTGVTLERDAEGRPRYTVTTSAGETLQARSLVIGTGRAPFVPEPFDTVDSPRVFHLTRYCRPCGSWRRRRGAAQGDGRRRQPERRRSSPSTSPGATRRPKSTTLVRSLTHPREGHQSVQRGGVLPGFTDYYYGASRERKDAIDQYMRLTNYSSADGDVLRELYRLIYEQRLDGEQRVFVSGSRQVRAVAVDGTGVRMTVDELNTGESEEHEADFVVLATGFRDLGPAPTRSASPR
ncbi:hypothetical protein Shyd_57850 [Streptomyces hydrogenans]|uniref:L-lysine N6-monooxygenase MbtG n=1 Tax=Streptomyces hydrogenans TaxID=1873719 RepID=A0ABQ3PHB5_9ACTN|nr:lysine N(6)-hydroxylase/L-ornithine N(5)-oxygenase family protein [Streptomyces hydrogenans]GHI24414.1 hypothetical protein Shyd_57850 [Streptomyces hydrogenans]